MITSPNEAHHCRSKHGCEKSHACRTPWEERDDVVEQGQNLGERIHVKIAGMEENINVRMGKDETNDKVPEVMTGRGWITAGRLGASCSEQQQHIETITQVTGE